MTAKRYSASSRCSARSRVTRPPNYSTRRPRDGRPIAIMLLSGRQSPSISCHRPPIAAAGCAPRRRRARHEQAPVSTARQRQWRHRSHLSSSSSSSSSMQQRRCMRVAQSARVLRHIRGLAKSAHVVRRCGIMIESNKCCEDRQSSPSAGMT